MTQLALLGFEGTPEPPDNPAPRRHARRPAEVVRLPLALNYRRLPATYKDCQRERAYFPVRLCPYLSCRHHLWTTRAEEFDALVDKPPGEWAHTCSLEVAEAVSVATPGTIPHVGDVCQDKPEDGHGVVLRKGHMAKLIGLSRERVRQLLLEGLERARHRPVMAEIGGDVDHAAEWAYDRGGVGATLDWLGEG